MTSPWRWFGRRFQERDEAERAFIHATLHLKRATALHMALSLVPVRRIRKLTERVRRTWPEET